MFIYVGTGSSTVGRTQKKLRHDLQRTSLDPHPDFPANKPVNKMRKLTHPIKPVFVQWILFYADAILPSEKKIDKPTIVFKTHLFKKGECI